MTKINRATKNPGRGGGMPSPKAPRATQASLAGWTQPKKTAKLPSPKKLQVLAVSTGSTTPSSTPGSPKHNRFSGLTEDDEAAAIQGTMVSPEMEEKKRPFKQGAKDKATKDKTTNDKKTNDKVTNDNGTKDKAQKVRQGKAKTTGKQAKKLLPNGKQDSSDSDSDVESCTLKEMEALIESNAAKWAAKRSKAEDESSEEEEEGKAKEARQMWTHNQR